MIKKIIGYCLLLPNEFSSRFLPDDIWKRLPENLSLQSTKILHPNEYWSCIISFSQSCHSKGFLNRAFGAIEKYEKDSILLFINQSLATHLRHRGQEKV